MSLSHHVVPQDPFVGLSRFRGEFYSCLTRRADALFELANAVLCSDGPVRSLVELSLVGEHRRGHGGLYDALSAGRVDVARLRRALATVPLPRASDGRLVLAADLTCWLRPSAHLTAADPVPHLRPGQGPAHSRSRLAVLGDLCTGNGPQFEVPPERGSGAGNPLRRDEDRNLAPATDDRPGSRLLRVGHVRRIPAHPLG